MPRSRRCRGMRALRRWWSQVCSGARRPAAPDRVDDRPGTTAPIRPAFACAAAVTRAEPTLAERRAEAMRRLFPLLSSWRAPPSYAQQLGAAYAHLAQAADATDLERRVRQLEQGTLHPAARRDAAMHLN